jgi:hydroxylaminobenzene mutase
MADGQRERILARAGVSLIILALLTGLAIPAFTNPRQALAAHVSAVLGGVMLIALSALWHRLVLSESQHQLASILAVAGLYANWVGSVLAAALGTNRLTPLAGTGFGATSRVEGLVQVIQVSQGVALLLALGLVAYGLRRPSAQ